MYTAPSSRRVHLPLSPQGQELGDQAVFGVNKE